ncbi:MAG: PAS domain-containing protein [Alphaproteobacteria bacterium]|nr:PAS domain-containing protein [Alphaproteobacteria bacterium]
MLSLNESILPPGTRFGEFNLHAGEEVMGKNPVMDFFYHYWLSKHSEGHLPRRSDIRPSEVARHLDHVVIMDVVRDSDSFALKVRLIGTHVANFYGEISGQDIKAIQNPNAVNRIYHLSGLVIAHKIPQMSVTPAFAPDRQYLEAYALYMPLFGDSDDVEKIMVAVDVLSLSRKRDFTA